MTTTKGRVLLVNDRATTKTAPTRLLRTMGYETTPSVGVVDALQRLHERSFDLIVSDVSMPQEGTSLLKRIREERIDLPFILLSKVRPRIHRRGQGMLFWLARFPKRDVLEETADRAIALHRRSAELRRALASSRNVSATQIELEETTATDARKDFAHMLETTARRGVVVVSKQSTPKAVLLSFDDFWALVTRTTRKLDTLSAEFDKMLVQMQTPTARAGMKTAFEATTKELGAAALAGAKARRKHG
jgi:prevent-host-death family protein